MEFDCIEKLKNHLENLSISEDRTVRKKADKLNYWIKDYVRFLQDEENIPAYKYKRGSIVKAHLGFRIGHEHGGLHFCVVINSKYYLTSGLLTVIPLTSISKPNKPLHHTSVYLGSELKDGLINKLELLQEKADQQSLVIQKYTELYDKFMLHHNSQDSKLFINFLEFIVDQDNYEHIKSYIPLDYLNDVKYKLLNKNTYDGFDYSELCTFFDINKLKAYTAKSIPMANRHIQEQEQNLASLQKQLYEISKMKDMSKALIDQITTVSSVRVFNPISSFCTLANIKLSNESLDKIDEKIKELFVNK